MSDEEVYELEDGEEEYEIEGSDGDLDDDEEMGDDEDDPNLIENTYYNAKGSMEDDVEDAIELFETIPDMEEEKGKWGFKATKKLVKLFFKSKKYDEMKNRFKELFGYSGVVTRNEYEKAINKVLDLVCQNQADLELIEAIFAMSIETLKKENNEKLWFKSEVKLGTMYLEQKAFSKLKDIIKSLKSYCTLEDGSFDEKKNQILLDALVLEIQLCNAEKNNKKIKILYNKCMNILKGAVVLSSRITGVIRECGGKMYMREKNWKEARNDFFEAFKSYDEEGNIRRINCLKYLILASMLTSSDINPFEANEVKPYKKHNDIIGMRDLLTYYTDVNIKSFEKTLKKNKKSIGDDDFMKDYIADLLKHMRTKVLTNLIKPYSRVKLDFLAEELSISSDDIEDLCIDLILDDKIQAKIDQTLRLLEIENTSNQGGRFDSMLYWTNKLDSIHSRVLSQIN